MNEVATIMGVFMHFVIRDPKHMNMNKHVQTFILLSLVAICVCRFSCFLFIAWSTLVRSFTVVGAGTTVRVYWKSITCCKSANILILHIQTGILQPCMLRSLSIVAAHTDSIDSWRKNLYIFKKGLTNPFA